MRLLLVWWWMLLLTGFKSIWMRSEMCGLIVSDWLTRGEPAQLRMMISPGVLQFEKLQLLPRRAFLCSITAFFHEGPPAMATSSSRESLKAQRHRLYCGIADALSVPGSGSADILSRLQTVLEAEACLSCIDGEDSVAHEPASSKSLAPRLDRAAAATPKSTAGHLAVSALQDLKAELAQRVQQTVKATRHHSKSMSCSSLLADLRAVQQEKASLAEQLAAARAAAAGQRKQHEQEVGP